MRSQVFTEVNSKISGSLTTSSASRSWSAAVETLKLFNPDGSETVDGLKTGYIDAGGSSIVLTGTRGGKRAVVVVLGSASADVREANAKRLLADALGALVW